MHHWKSLITLNSQKNKTTLTNKQRKDIIEFKNNNPNTSNVDFVKWVKEEFGLEVHPTTIGRLLKNKNDIGDNPSKKRQRTIKKHGEDASVDDNIVADAISKLREVLKEYKLKDIYNMDETGLFYR
ncbi:19684_t:CDS:2, partial [Gigaspora margarita]